jgi:simple sugar transport system permease protein
MAVTTTSNAASGGATVMESLKRFAPYVTAIGVVIALVVSYNWDSVQTEAVIAATVRAAAPLLLGALCGLIGERSGVVNIGIDGQMLFAAFVGFMASSYTAGAGALVSIGVGVLAGMTGAALFGLFLAWCAVTLKMDQIIAGTVMNIFALGITTYLYVQGRTQPFYPNWKVPYLSELPIVGKAIFDNGPLTYAALIIVVIVHVALFHTRWGLRTRATGEHPSAADTVGVNIVWLRYRNLMIAGTLAGLAGMLLIQSASVFNRGMTNGKGFIALAVMLVGRYRPFGALGAALLLGFFTALQSQLQFNQAFDVPPQFFGMIPFALTVVVLAVAGLAARPPAAAGKPYEKE